jgi:hypothetical protein
MSMNSQYQEIWIETSDGPAMCALINNEVGWLMYLRHKGDSGFSSRNSKYQGSLDAVIEYVLSNGQKDAYPASWALPVGEVKRALEYFRQTSSPPPFVLWCNESDDGMTLPYEAEYNHN